MKPAYHTVLSCVWGGDLLCFHCGERLKLSAMLPCAITVVVAAGKAFGKQHKRCKLRDAGGALREEHEAAYDALPKPTEGNA